MPTTASRIIVNAKTGQSYTETYEIPDPTPEELAEAAAKAKEKIIQDLSNALSAMINQTAQSRRYNSVDSAGSKYKDLNLDMMDPNYTILLKYKTESTALVDWNAKCWATLEAILLGAEKGENAIPTTEILLESMPALIW